MTQKKNIAILGSTGSIGRQALQVIEEHHDAFQVEVLTAANNIPLLVQQAKKFKPNAVVISNSEHYQELKNCLAGDDIKVYAGENALAAIVEMDSIDLVLTALSDHVDSKKEYRNPGKHWFHWPAGFASNRRAS